MEITFQLPKEFTQLIERLDNIERLLAQKSIQPKSSSDELLTVEEAAKFLHLSVPTIYGLIAKNAIPFMKPEKRVYFLKEGLIDYICKNKKKSSSEIEADTDAFLSSYKRKGVRHA